jgi:hypothetical protein
MRRYLNLIGSTIVAAIFLMFVTSPPALSQAGSIGGVIGKTNKSVSGREESSAPARRARTGPDRGQALPNTIMITEHYGLTYTITLHKAGKSTYQGTWSHGYVTTFTVTKFTADSLNMLREDKPAFGSVTGTYTGVRSGNSAHGKAAISNGAVSKWDATW